MEVQVNIFAVFLSMVAAMAIGFMWYAKPVFGATWMKLIKMSDKKAKEASGIAIVWAVVASFVTAYVLAFFTALTDMVFGYGYLQSALTTAVWAWLGFFFTTAVMHDGFEQRPFKLTAINTANSLATLLVMAVIIGLFGV